MHNQLWGGRDTHNSGIDSRCFHFLLFLWRRQRGDQCRSWPIKDNRTRLRTWSGTHNANISRNWFAKWVFHVPKPNKEAVRPNNPIPTAYLHSGGKPGLRYENYSGYWCVPGLARALMSSHSRVVRILRWCFRTKYHFIKRVCGRPLRYAVV